MSTAINQDKGVSMYYHQFMTEQPLTQAQLTILKTMIESFDKPRLTKDEKKAQSLICSMNKTESALNAFKPGASDAIR